MGKRERGREREREGERGRGREGERGGEREADGEGGAGGALGGAAGGAGWGGPGGVGRAALGGEGRMVGMAAEGSSGEYRAVQGGWPGSRRAGRAVVQGGQDHGRPHKACGPRGVQQIC